MIDDAQENEFINSIMQFNGTWIGHSRPTDQDEWTNVYGDVTYTNWAHVNQGGNANDLTGYALTYGNEWYNHDENDNRHYILEYGPVASSELESSVLVQFTGDARIGQDSDNDYLSSATEATIAANSQKTTITLTGIDDSIEESIEEITVSLALKTNDADENISNVDLGDVTSVTYQVSDDEEPLVSYASSETDISENGGSVTITASLSNPKMSPTVINLSLEGTSTKLEDYSVSTIFSYSDFVGKSGITGSSNGVGENARFDRPYHIHEYTNGSIIIADRSAWTISQAESNGTVTKLLGNPYSYGDGSGDASEININTDGLGGLEVDMSTGDIYYTDYSRIYMFDVSENTVTKIHDGNERIGGLGLLNGELYFTHQFRMTVNKLTYDGSSYSMSNVVGQDGSGQWRDENDQYFGINDVMMYDPTEITVDSARNRLYIQHNEHSGWVDGRHRITVIDFNNNSQKVYANILPRSAAYSKLSFDSSNDKLYTIGYQNLYVIEIDEQSGELYLGGTKDNLYSGTFGYSSSAISDGILYAAAPSEAIVGRISLGATISIPAGQTTNSITLSAFKDPWFESDETIDVNISSISNGFSNSNDVSDVNIIESTKLTLVADAPFEGVENGKVSWGDYDRDGDMDLALMGDASTGTITNVYKNNGEGGFTNTLQNFTKVIGGDIEFVDVDQDGYLDVAVSGNSASGRVSKLYINSQWAVF